MAKKSADESPWSGRRSSSGMSFPLWSGVVLGLVPACTAPMLSTTGK